MPKAKPTQIEMELVRVSEADPTAGRASNVVDAYQYRIKAHTEKVIEKLRDDGLLPAKRSS